ncbi:hypothetical protein [Bacillus sp. FSL K6-3431]
MTFRISSPFDFAMIGKEISGYTNQEERTVKDVGYNFYISHSFTK